MSSRLRPRSPTQRPAQPISAGINSDLKRKRRLARAVAELVRHRELVFMDRGSTNIRSTSRVRSHGHVGNLVGSAPRHDRGGGVVGCDRKLAEHGRRFLVPSDEYAGRGQFGFVIDPARHTEYHGPSSFIGWRSQSGSGGRFSVISIVWPSRLRRAPVGDNGGSLEPSPSRIGRPPLRVHAAFHLSVRFCADLVPTTTTTTTTKELFDDSDFGKDFNNGMSAGRFRGSISWKL